MKNHLKLTNRIMLYQIAVSALCFTVIPGLFFFLRQSLNEIIIAFSVIMGLYLFFLDFVESNRIGIKERRNMELYNGYNLKGFILGLLGQLPVWIINFLLIELKDSIFAIFEKRDILANVFNLQYMWILYPLKFSVISYAITFLMVPLVCAIGYYTGYKGFSYEDKYGSVRKK